MRACSPTISASRGTTMPVCGGVLQKNTISEIPPDTPGFYSNVLLVHEASGGWRPVIDLKTTECPHRHSSLSHAHYKLSAEYRRKRRLCVQNRSAGYLLSCTKTSRQQEVPSFLPLIKRYTNSEYMYFPSV